MVHARLSCHGHDPDGVLGVGVNLCLEEDVNGVGLGVETCRRVVAVAHVLRVVDDDHRSFERHLGQIFCCINGWKGGI